MATNSVTGSGTTNGVLGRAARAPGQLWQVPVFLFGLSALLLVAAMSPFGWGPGDDKLESDLATIRAALEKPGVPPDEIVALAENTLAHASSNQDLAGQVNGSARSARKPASTWSWPSCSACRRRTAPA